MRIGFCLTPLLALCLTPGWAGELKQELNADQLKQIERGRQIMTTEDVANAPWPRATIYQYIPATPMEVMAVFFDYERARNYIPSVEKSEVVTKHGLWDKDVAYTIDVPLFPDESYTCRNTLKKTTRPGQLKVGWKLLQATSIKESVGHLTIEPMGEGSLVRYTNLTDPGSSLAPVLKTFALNQMRKTVQALSNEVLRHKSQNPAALDRQVLTLEKAMAAMNGGDSARSR